MLIEKSRLPLVAMDFMNDVHNEDIDIINKLYNLILHYKKENKDELIADYSEWIRHTENHFKGEEVMMLSKNFPPYQFHKSEHEKALNVMRTKLESFIENNEIQILKDYFEYELISWLLNHIQTMDTVTAMFLKTGLSPCSQGN